MPARPVIGPTLSGYSRVFASNDMASLYITREGHWFDRFRDYRIMLDGTEVARVGRDEKVRVRVSPGWHKLYAKIAWCTSKEVSFELLDHEERRFEVGSNTTPARLLIPFFPFVYSGDYLYLREVNQIGYSPYRTSDAGAG
jgi:hypothetical protein